MTLQAVPFDDTCLPILTELYGTPPRPTPYAVRGVPCWEWTLEATETGTPVHLVLWLPLRRVDARLGNSTWVLKGVDQVEILPGTEAIFRRHDPAAFLFVTRRGRCSLVT